MQLGNPLTALRFAPANDCVLFVFVKLALVTLLSRTLLLGGRFQSCFHSWSGELNLNSKCSLKPKLAQSYGNIIYLKMLLARFGNLRQSSENVEKLLKVVEKSSDDFCKFLVIFVILGKSSKSFEKSWEFFVKSLVLFENFERIRNF